MSFLSALKRFGTDVLKIGQYVEFGAQVTQQFIPEKTPASDFLAKIVDIVEHVEVTGQAAAQIAGSTALTGPQKLAAATALTANELTRLNIGGKQIKDAALFAKAAQGFAQATVDYLQAFDESAVVALPPQVVQKASS